MQQTRLAAIKRAFAVTAMIGCFLFGKGSESFPQRVAASALDPSVDLIKLENATVGEALELLRRKNPVEIRVGFEQVVQSLSERIDKVSWWPDTQFLSFAERVGTKRS
jgi:hypothetical protein